MKRLPTILEQHAGQMNLDGKPFQTAMFLEVKDSGARMVSLIDAEAILARQAARPLPGQAQLAIDAPAAP